MQRTRFLPGTINIWFILIALIILGLVGMAMDAAHVYLAGQRLQAAADAGALAGAQEVRGDIPKARLLARSTSGCNTVAGAPVAVELNPDNLAGGDIVVGFYDQDLRQFTPTLTGANAVKVVTRLPNSQSGPLQLVFGPFFGLGNVSVTRMAIAMSGGGNGAGVLVLNPTAPSALDLSGNPTLAVDGGTVQVNSVSPVGFTANGNATLAASNLNVCGSGISLTGNAHVETHVRTRAGAVSNPLAELALPTPGPTQTLPSGNNITIDPGYYPAGINVGDNRTLRLNPGIYVLDGAGLSISGNANVYAPGVMLFIIGTGRISLGGNGTIQISPPTAGPYADISIFQDPACSKAASITGNNKMSLEGVMYFPGAQVNLSGNGGAMGNQIIADRVAVSGNGTIRINYTGTNAAGGKVFLVE